MRQIREDEIETTGESCEIGDVTDCELAVATWLDELG